MTTLTLTLTDEERAFLEAEAEAARHGLADPEAYLRTLIEEARELAAEDEEFNDWHRRFAAGDPDSTGPPGWKLLDPESGQPLTRRELEQSLLEALQEPSTEMTDEDWDQIREECRRKLAERAGS